MNSVAKAFGGGSPDPIIIPAPAPAPIQEKTPAAADLPDPEAARVARERAAQEKLRKGRKNLRIDLASTGSTGGGSGVFIPG